MVRFKLGTWHIRAFYHPLFIISAFASALPHPQSNFSALCWNAEHVLRSFALAAFPPDTPDPSVHVRFDSADRHRINHIPQHCPGCHLLHFTHNIERAFRVLSLRRKSSKVIKQDCHLAELHSHWCCHGQKFLSVFSSLFSLFSAVARAHSGYTQCPARVMRSTCLLVTCASAIPTLASPALEEGLSSSAASLEHSSLRAEATRGGPN